MMDLSIIVPAYNASTTINETLASLEVIVRHCEGKLIIVDDGSTDGTINIVEKWQKKLNEKLLVLKHDNNLGGGATRNTGINAADTTYVLVCDSDDISDLESVKKLYNVASNHEWGCAHYQYARYFRKRISKVDSTDNYFNIYNSDKIILEDALANSLLVNFLFKKDNWVKAGGYPEHHGWDTQGFSIRYLLSNPGVLIAPETFYYHRRFFGNFSYYERENLSGRTLLNSWLTVEEMIGKIPDHWFNDILKSPVLSSESSLEIIKRNIKSNKNSDLTESHLIDKTFSICSSFIKGNVEFREGKFEQSLNTLNKLFSEQYPSEIIFYSYLRSSIAQFCGDGSNPSTLAFEFLQNIGQKEPSLRISKVQIIKKLFNYV